MPKLTAIHFAASISANRAFLIATRGSEDPDSIHRRTCPTVTECETNGGRT
jgi:hypothetical protein